MRLLAFPAGKSAAVQDRVAALERAAASVATAEADVAQLASVPVGGVTASGGHGELLVRLTGVRDALVNELEALDPSDDGRPV